MHSINKRQQFSKRFTVSIVTHSRRKGARPNPEWGTVHSRIAWLVRTKFADSRTALAKAIGFSHTIVAEVVRGRVPGPRLRDAIVARLHVDRAWLETGAGQPFAGDSGEVLGVPVTNVPLPGPPLAHRGMLTGRITVPEVVSSPTVYWLVLQSNQPVVRHPGAGFRVGDQLLMESDPAKFPGEADLFGDLCVVRGGAGGSELRLATVEYRGAGFDDDGPRLEADYHDAIKPDEAVVEDVYRHYPGGEVQYLQRRRTHVPGRGTGPGIEPFPPVVRYGDIVSVWRKILRRHLG
jgi:hypothetical protein